MSDFKREAVDPVAWMYTGLYPNSVPPFRKDRADGYTVPLIPATTLDDMQRRLEAAEEMLSELVMEASSASLTCAGNGYMMLSLDNTLARSRTLLRGDGKGDADLAL